MTIDNNSKLTKWEQDTMTFLMVCKRRQDQVSIKVHLNKNPVIIDL